MLVIASSIILAAAQAAGGADHAGKAVYEQYCAACHNQPEATRAPALSALQQMSAQTLRFSLTEGIMRQQGSAVPREQFEQLIAYLAPADTSERLRTEADEVICLMTPESFYAVGEHYDDFRQTSDREVTMLLDEAQRWSRESAP